MKKLLLSAASASALILSTGAYADTNNTERTVNQKNMPVVTEKDIKKGWDNTKEAVSETAEDVSEATKDAYEATKEKTKEVYNDIIDAVKDGETIVTSKQVYISKDAKVSGVLGQPLNNTQGERIGLIKDLIVDKNGKIEMLILGDGNYFGLGKTVAFDYDVITKRDVNGDIISPLTEESIQSAASFSYDQADANEKTKVIPANGYSINDVLEGHITSPKDKNLATIDDAVISNGEISHFIIGYDKTMGMGGKQVVIAFDDTSSVVTDESVDFQLNLEKAAQFQIYKNSMKN